MTTRHIDSLQVWDKNPRNITRDGLDRLKKQITKLGQYKPLLITEDGTILGGNMRYQAYKALGIDNVWVSVVNPKDENEMLEYALSDNDRAGYYDEDMLANLIPNYDIDWSEYSVDLKEPMIIADLLDQFKEVESFENTEIDEHQLGDSANLVFKYEYKTYLNLLDQLQKAQEVLELDTKEEVLVKLLENYV